MFYGPRVRTAAHVGLVLQDEGYFGPALMKTSELCGKARPGEVLMSEECHAAAKGFLTPDAFFVQGRCLPVEEDVSMLNWREAERMQDVIHLLRPGEMGYTAYPRELAWRHALIPEITDLYDHERLQYNPNWHLRFCNLPPEYWDIVD